ncbi:MAG: M50 family metallopeptidase, partial [Elusimicrobia bacterium]|nr:M50 family metallopeptidase [Elusimicrobiota bacterium]
MTRLLAGVLLLPLSGALAWGAAKALADVALAAPSAAPFLAGMALVAAAWLIGRHVLEPGGRAAHAGRAARWAYVAGHEMTHALAAWATGGKVFAIKIGEKGGHVDLSESGALVALAPYCVPLHALLVVLGYRVLLWLDPGARAEPLFLGLMGAALAFHAVMTFDTLTQVKQPDLDAAGGTVFSLALILAANGLLVLVLLKALFPESVALRASAASAAREAWRFWSAVGRLSAPAARAL